MQKRIIVVLVIFIISSMMWFCESNENVVAKVGDLKITKDDVINYLKKNYPNEPVIRNISIEKKKDALDKLIAKKRKVNAALDIDLDKDPQIAKFMISRKEQLLGNKYYEKMIVDKLVNETDVNDYLAKRGVEMKATHVLIGFDKANVASKRNREEAEKLAEKVLQEAKNGVDFTTLAEKYSDDPSVKNNQGDLGYFRWGEMVEPFQEACWNMKPGEITGPVLTKHGFHVIRLDDRRDVAGYTPGKDAESILQAKQALFAAKADSGKKMWEKHFTALKEKRNFKIAENNIRKTSALIAEKIKTENIAASSFNQQEKGIKLITWDGGEITLNDLIEKYDRSLARAFGMFTDPEAMQKDLENTSMIRLVVTEAEKMGLDEEEDVEKVLEEFQESRLENLVVQREVREKINITEEDIRKYYDENPDQFKKPAQIEIWEIQLDTEAEANRIKRLVNKNNFEKMAKKYSTDKFFAKKGGFIGMRNVNSRGVVSREAFEAGPGGKIFGPVNYRRKWVIGMIGSEKEESIRSFKEARPSARGKLNSQMIRERMAEWEKSLEDNYPVTIYEDKLETLE